MINWKNVMLNLDQIQWDCWGRNEQRPEAQELLASMRETIETEMRFADRYYASTPDWEVAARNAVDTSDDIEVDEDAKVSPGRDDGAFVQVWMGSLAGKYGGG